MSYGLEVLDRIDVEGNPINNIDPEGLLTCGSGWNEPFVPDNPFTFKFSNCCAEHDKCYGTCGADKADCDLKFFHCMRNSCEKRHPFIKYDCQAIASNYYYAVKNYGQSAFDNAQKQACACP